MKNPAIRQQAYENTANSAIDAKDVSTASTDFTTDTPTRAIWVGTGGDLKVQMYSGAIATFSGIPNGRQLDLAVVKIYKTGTTATGVTAMF